VKVLKTVKQRIRRAIKEGLINIANAGFGRLFMMKLFNQYSRIFYLNFENVRGRNGSYRGKNHGGKVNINRYFSKVY